MPEKPKPQPAPVPKKEPFRVTAENAELSAAELDEVSGGKLPGKRTPPTLTLK